MKELLIISGKGGTGKTTVLGSFAALAQNKILADADVDAPNLHLLLSPQPVEEKDYSGAKLAVIDEAVCTQCGRCEGVCEFDAVENFTVDERRCEGCATCALVCPVRAISMREQVTGRLYLSDTRHGPLVHARLLAGAEASGKLVTEVRQLGRRVGASRGAELMLTDGSPGIGCPVIASLSGVDVALAVSEPTPSGLHDLGRVLEVAAHFGVRTAVCVNKWDINGEMTEKIERLASAMGATPVGRIPFDEAVVEATAEAIPLVEHGDGPAAKAIKALWTELTDNGAL